MWVDTISSTKACLLDNNHRNICLFQNIVEPYIAAYPVFPEALALILVTCDDLVMIPFEIGLG